ncbi:hypothetical protein PVAP13_1NG439219 [Panicum virgatum]|uniref:Uncharacterized protein n=1 Tax=Panicum virgatum TaxID=38727 RepID=A0A8T0X1D1_PANVG|nr:hypothetical protein PVAP13_1NG439219 [Panicum virgatum]
MKNCKKNCNRLLLRRVGARSHGLPAASACAGRCSDSGSWPAGARLSHRQLSARAGGRPEKEDAPVTAELPSSVSLSQSTTRALHLAWRCPWTRRSSSSWHPRPDEGSRQTSHK